MTVFSHFLFPFSMSSLLCCFYGDIYRSNIQKNWKWVFLHGKIYPSKVNSMAFFDNLLGLTEKHVLNPLTLIWYLRRVFFSDDCWAIINDHFWSFRQFLFHRSKWPLKIAQKHSVPRKKIDKNNFNVHGPRIIFHQLTLIRVLRNSPQFGGEICQNFLLIFWLLKKWKMALFKSKNLCDDSLKIKKIEVTFFLNFPLALLWVLRFDPKTLIGDSNKNFQ